MIADIEKGGRRFCRPLIFQKLNPRVFSALLVFIAACSLASKSGEPNAERSLSNAAARFYRFYYATDTETPNIALTIHLFRPQLQPAQSTSTATDSSTPMVLNPLTGLPVSDPSTVMRRPIGIQGDEYPRSARKAYQAGLSDADVLFEYYQESGDTRFHASTWVRIPSVWGPIRSGPCCRCPSGTDLQSIFVFSAADYRVWNCTSSRMFVSLPSLRMGPAPCPAICQDTSIP